MNTISKIAFLFVSIKVCSYNNKGIRAILSQKKVNGKTKNHKDNLVVHAVEKQPCQLITKFS